MLNIRNLVLAFAIIVLCGLSVFNAYAQIPPGVQAALSRHQLQLLSKQMATRTFMNMNRDWRTNAGQGNEYIVKFKNGDKIKFNSDMHLDTVLHKDFLVHVNKKFKKSDSVNRFQKIYPEQTSAIGLVVDFDVEDPSIGLPTDSGWNIKVIKGAINVYARSGNYLDVTSVPTFGQPKMDFIASEIIGIQLNKGPIEKLSKESILKIVATNAKATEFVEKKGFYEAVKRYNRDAANAPQR